MEQARLYFLELPEILKRTDVIRIFYLLRLNHKGCFESNLNFGFMDFFSYGLGSVSNIGLRQGLRQFQTPRSS